MMACRNFARLMALGKCHTSCYRGMAKNVNYFVEGASQAAAISPEVKDLIANSKHAENIDEWEREPGIGEPIRFSQYRVNPEDVDDDSQLDMVYFPHKGEEPWPTDVEPSPVLLVQRVKTLREQPWWHKMDCEKIGLGRHRSMNARVALPNLSFYTALLYRIKHLVRITPVSFPDAGLPGPDEFDAKAATVTCDGKFLYDERIATWSRSVQQPDRMAMERRTFESHANLQWSRPKMTPVGNANYHRDTTVDRPELLDLADDPSNNIKF